MRALRLVLLFPIAAVGCVMGPALIPAPEAVSPAQPDVAAVEVAGVRLWADADAWRGTPYALSQVLTPVRITLENHSGHPVRVAYRDFTLLGGSGFRYAALPPFSLEGAVGSAASPVGPLPVAYPVARTVVVVQPRFQARRFLIARPYAHYYVGISPWPYPWAWDPLYYDRWYAAWPSQLPTRDMLERALPEGVIEDGGSISGFVYFQRARQEATVQLQFELRDAQTDVHLGTASLPFLVRRR